MKCSLRRIMVDKDVKDISDLMRRTGLSYNTVKKLYYQENLETIKLGTVKTICEVLQCQIEDLIHS